MTLTIDNNPIVKFPKGSDAFPNEFLRKVGAHLIRQSDIKSVHMIKDTLVVARGEKPLTVFKFIES